METLIMGFNIFFALVCILCVFSIIMPKIPTVYLPKLYVFLTKKRTIDIIIFTWTSGLCLIFLYIVLLHGSPANYTAKILPYKDISKELESNSYNGERSLSVDIQFMGDQFNVTQADFLATVVYVLKYYTDQYGYHEVKVTMKKNQGHSSDILAMAMYNDNGRLSYCGSNLWAAKYTKQGLEYIEHYNSIANSNHIAKDAIVSKKMGIPRQSIKVFSHWRQKPESFCLVNRARGFGLTDCIGYECVRERILLRHPVSTYDVVLYWSLLLSTPLLFLLRKYYLQISNYLGYILKPYYFLKSKISLKSLIISCFCLPFLMYFLIILLDKEHASLNATILPYKIIKTEKKGDDIEVTILFIDNQSKASQADFLKTVMTVAKFYDAEKIYKKIEVYMLAQEDIPVLSRWSHGNNVLAIASYESKLNWLSYRDRWFLLSAVESSFTKQELEYIRHWHELQAKGRVTDIFADKMVSKKMGIAPKSLYSLKYNRRKSPKSLCMLGWGKNSCYGFACFRKEVLSIHE